MTGGSTSGVVPVYIAETVTSPPATSKSNPSSNSKAAQPEQRFAYKFMANQGFVLISLGQEEVKREERPAGFLSGTGCLLTAHGLSQAKASHLSPELPPDCEQDFTFTYVEGGTFNFHLISHHSWCVCVCTLQNCLCLQLMWNTPETTTYTLLFNCSFSHSNCSSWGDS